MAHSGKGIRGAVLGKMASMMVLSALLLSPSLCSASFAPGIVRNPAPPVRDDRPPHPTPASPLSDPRRPQMGWRSWNFFQCNINQGIMQAQMDALTLPRHGTSLLRLGYEAVGLDDCWQSCTGKGGSFHDEAGQPMINTSLFPSMAAMVEHGHAQGVKVGFYQVSQPPPPPPTPGAR